MGLKYNIDSLEGNSMMQMSRRKLITTGLNLSAFVMAGFGMRAIVSSDTIIGSRRLSIFVPETGERSTITYYSKGEYLIDGIKEINWILRDYKSNKIGNIDVNLLNILESVVASSGEQLELEVVRGFINEDHNNPLAEGSPNAYHNKGQAVDVRIKGVSLEDLATEFSRYFDGGIGFYPGQNFVHLDLGPSRRWSS